MPREPGWWSCPAGFTATVLAPAAFVYGRLTRRRLDQATPYDCGVPVICVGNFTAGGTGKTPLAIKLMGDLAAGGHRPVILSRGYGGRLAGPHWVEAQRDRASDVGDEPLLLARSGPTLICRDRRAGAHAIRRDRPDTTVIVMDDGLQNPALAKTVSIAVVDGARGFGNGRVIPAGPLRASLGYQLGLVQAVLINGGDTVRADEIAAGLSARFAGAVLRGGLVPQGDLTWLAGARVVAYAGIGNPERFFATLKAAGADIVDRIALADHQPFTPALCGEILAGAQRIDALPVTTQKDHVRLDPTNPPERALADASFALPVAMTLAPDSEAALAALISARLVAPPASW